MKFSTIMAINAAGIVAGAPVICMITPPATVQAGSAMTATIENPQKNRCEATLKFTNPDFLPIHFGFQPLTCRGFQVAEITIPSEAPNGDAYVLWQCTNLASPTCSHVLITGGVENASSIVLNQYGRISCPSNVTLTMGFASNPLDTIAESTAAFPLTSSLSMTSAGFPIASSVPLASTFSTLYHSWTNSSTPWRSSLAIPSETLKNSLTTTCVMS